MGLLTSFNQDYLTISCSLLSPSNPTSIGWDFGDSTPIVTSKNATHTYVDSGFYTIKVTADGVEKSFQVGASAYGECLPDSIYSILLRKVPAGVVLTDEEVSDAIQKWQLNLSAYINVTWGIYNELAFTPLVNLLIIDLALYTILENYARKYLLNAASTTSKEIKNIESGPTKAEWYSNSDIMKNIIGKGGFLELLKENICLQARESNIPIYICKRKSPVTILPIKIC